MQCNHCPATAPLNQHHDVRCIKHLSDANSCPNVPENEHREAHLLLMQKGGIEVIQVSDDEDTPGPGPAQKKARGPTGQVVAMKKGKTSGLDSFLDQAMSADEVDRANIRLLRYEVND